MKVRKQRTLIKISASAALFATLGSTAQAIPDPSKGSWTSFDPATAQAIASDPVLTTTNIYRDHKSSVLYVSPSRTAINAGIYRNVGTADCVLLKRQHLMTYDLPAPGTFRETALNGSYSPFFDYQMGNYIFFRSTFDKLFKSAATIDEFNKNNQALIQNKLTLEATDASLTLQVNKVEAEIKAFDTRLAQLMNLLSFAVTPEEIAGIRAEIEEVKRDKAEQVPGLRVQLRDLQRQKLANETKLIPVVAEYDSKKPPNFDDVVTEYAKLSTTIQQLNKLAEDAKNVSEAALDKLNQKTVGTASASYSIWNDEESRLRSKLAGTALGSYSVSRLPIFNVTLKKDIGKSVLTSTVTAGPQQGGQTSSFDDYSSAGLPVGTGVETAAEVFTTNDKTTGAPVEVAVPEKDLGSGASGTVNALVTQDAFCSGMNTKEIKEYREPVNISGSTIQEIAFQTPQFKERGTSEVIGQTVAFDYAFHAKADPISIACTMDISKFQNYVRNAGSSGFLWWRKKWDNSQREQVQNSGLRCDVDINPNGTDPVKQAEYVDKLRQAMMQEMAADFVLNYAKSYQVSTVDPNANIKPEKADIGRTMGPAMAALCGTNLYCQIGSIVLKTADEMFGSQKGKYSNTDVMTGTIRRDYSERSFFTQPDSSKTTISVRVN